jgi:hypothetical protein
MQAQLPVIKIPGSDYNATGQREAFLTQAFALASKCLCTFKIFG